LDSGFLIRFPGLADFEVARDGLTGSCHPCRGLDPDTRDHLFQNQVRPLMLSLQGVLTFHGSAVDLGGAAVAFLAASGRGKSTLAAALARRGHHFLTDDCLVIERGEQGYLALPSIPSIRLRNDSRAALLTPASTTAPAVSYSTKGRFAASPELPHCTRPLPIRAAYFLGDAAAEEIGIRRITGGETVPAWVAHSFLLDVNDPAALAQHFDEIADLAHVLPSFYLDYPRRYDQIDPLRRALLDHADELDAAQ